MLRDDIERILDIFEDFGITEEHQRTIFMNGIDCKLNKRPYSDRWVHLNPLGFSILLSVYKYYGERVNANALVSDPTKAEDSYVETAFYSQTAYIALQKLNDNIEKKNKQKKG